jgi:hypothetical protein
MQKERLKSFCLMLSNDMHKKIFKETKTLPGISMCQWIREAIDERFKRKGKN